MVTVIRSYEKLMQLKSFKERFDYLNLNGLVGVDTFGTYRYLNQALYTSKEWRQFRRKIIMRDNGCDLACSGREINDKILIHHINPITVDDIKNRSHCIFDPNNVICVCNNTHLAIHYGDHNLLFSEPVTRTQNDTCPWK